MAALERRGAGFGYSLILLPGATAYADAAHHLVTALERNAAGEDHHASVIRSVNAKELIAGLAMRGEILGSNIEGASGPRLVLRDVDTADPRLIHTDVRYQVPAGIHYGNVHGLADLRRFLFGGGDDSSCVCEGNHYDSVTRPDLPRLIKSGGSLTSTSKPSARFPTETEGLGARKAGLPAPAVARSLEHMKRPGILPEITGRERYRLFIYEPYLAILNEGTEPPR
jgi:hypothetical protein